MALCFLHWPLKKIDLTENGKLLRLKLVPSSNLEVHLQLLRKFNAICMKVALKSLVNGTLPHIQCVVHRCLQPYRRIIKIWTHLLASLKAKIEPMTVFLALRDRQHQAPQHSVHNLDVEEMSKLSQILLAAPKKAFKLLHSQVPSTVMMLYL